MTIAIVLLASFLHTVQPGNNACAQADRYVLEMRLNPTGAWQPVDTTTGLTFETPCNHSGIVEHFRVVGTRTGVSTFCGNEHANLYLDWTLGKTHTVTYSGWSPDADSTGLVYVQLPEANWLCVFRYEDNIPAWVHCDCQFDYDNNHRINLSDMVRFSRTHYTTSDLVRFAGLYNKAIPFDWTHKP
jgi:hypothetical protein